MLVRSSFAVPIDLIESGWHEFMEPNITAGFSVTTVDDEYAEIIGANQILADTLTVIEKDYRLVTGLPKNQPLEHDILVRSGSSNRDALFRNAAQNFSNEILGIAKVDPQAIDTGEIPASIIHIDDCYHEENPAEDEAWSYGISDREGTIHYKQRFWLPTTVKPNSITSAATGLLVVHPQIRTRGKQAKPNVLVRFNPHTDAHQKPITSPDRSFMRDTVTTAKV